MKTLADFKRALQPGTKWEGYNHYYKSSFGVREIASAMSTKFGFKHIRDDGTMTVSWCDYPKAGDISFKEDGTVNIYKQWQGERQLLLSYKQVA
jgi:hypothetical protein